MDIRTQSALLAGIVGTAIGVSMLLRASRPRVVAAFSAFALVVGGMLAVIYGFFFRPRELRISGDQVALVYWDGNGKKMRRDQVEEVKARPGSIVLRGPGKRLVIGRIFNDWDRIKTELAGWEKA